MSLLMRCTRRQLTMWVLLTRRGLYLANRDLTIGRNGVLYVDESYLNFVLRYAHLAGSPDAWIVSIRIFGSVPPHMFISQRAFRTSARHSFV